MENNAKQLIAWNCDLQQSLQFSEYSLMKVETCENISQQYNPPISKNGQLIQAKRYEDLKVIECKLSASFYTAYCSYNLISGYRLWDSQGQIMDTNVELSQSECERAITTNKLKYQDRSYYSKSNFLEIDLSPANTASGWLTLRGKSDAIMGTCLPESFKLGRNLYASHVLTMKYDISIKNINAVFNTQKRLIRINEHILIPNTLSGSYFSPLLGNYHWDKIDQGNLTDDHWLEITKGTVSLYFPTLINSTMPIGVVKTQTTGSSLALSLTEQTTLCLSYSCREAHKTQLKDVYLVLYSTTGQSHWPLKTVSGSEINRLHNLEASISSIYLSRELRLTSTFERISLELCQRNREIILSNIQDYINNVLIQQDNNNESQGRYFIRSGSVLYAIKCKEQVAWLRGNTSDCYEHAPIYYKDKNNNIVSGFIDPITYIIQPTSQSKKCNDILPFKFNLMGLDGTTEWICRTSQGWNLDCRAPKTLAPMHPGNLYVADDKVIISNLYSESQLESLQELQWEKTENEHDLKEWEEYLRQIRMENPDISSITYFENLKNSIDGIVDIFSASFWIKMALKHFMPIIILNYIFNVVITLIKGFLYVKKLHKVTGYKFTLILKGLLSIIAAIFPVFIIPGINKQKEQRCQCESEAFVEKMIKTLEDRERQRFLKNLEL